MDKPRKGDVVRFERRRLTVYSVSREAVTLVTPDGTEYIGVHLTDRRLRPIAP